MYLLLLCLACVIIARYAEKKHYRVVTVANSVLFVFLSVFFIIASNNPILALACKNIFGEYYAIIHGAFRESMTIFEISFSSLFIIEMVIFAIAAVVAFKAVIEGAKTFVKKLKLNNSRILSVIKFDNEDEIEIKKENKYNNFNFIKCEKLLI